MSTPRKIDVLILTPIKEEFDGVRILLENDREYKGIEYYRLGEVLRPDGYRLSVALRLTGPRADGITRAVHISLSEFDPRTIILFGTAGALGKTQLNDVLIGTDGCSYEKVKEEEAGEKFIFESIRCSEFLVGQAKRVLDQPGPEPWQYLIPGTGRKDAPTVRFGPITSGEKTLKNLDSLTMTRIKRHQSNAIGVEQEAYQFLSALPEERRHTAINIRVASDTIAGKNLQNAQGSKVQAVEVGTAFLLYFLRYADLWRTPLSPEPKRKPLTLSAMALIAVLCVASIWWLQAQDSENPGMQTNNVIAEAEVVPEEPSDTLLASSFQATVKTEEELILEPSAPTSPPTSPAPAPAPENDDRSPTTSPGSNDEPRSIPIVKFTDRASLVTEKGVLKPNLKNEDSLRAFPETSAAPFPIPAPEVQHVLIVIEDPEGNMVYRSRGPLIIDSVEEFPEWITQSEATATQSAKGENRFTLTSGLHTISFPYQDSTYKLTLNVLPNKKFQSFGISIPD